MVSEPESTPEPDPILPNTAVPGPNTETGTQAVATNSSMGNLTNRMLYDYLWGSTTDIIYDQCLCRRHVSNQGNLLDRDELVDNLNKEIMGRREFWLSVLGAIKDVSEYVASPSAGPAVDSYVSSYVYFGGSFCKKNTYKDKKGKEVTEYEVDEDLIHSLVEIIRRSYNDMASEDCDWPLYRQLVSASLTDDFFKGHIDCFREEFVLDISFTFRCHGHCDSGDPLFADYKSSTRQLYLDTNRAQAEPETTARVDRKVQPESRKATRLDRSLAGKESYYKPKQGLCSLEGASNPQSPSLDGWKSRAKSFAPAAISSVDIFSKRLCRCADEDESFYYASYHPPYYDVSFLVNGIYVIPNSECPTSSSGNVFSC